MGAWYTGELMQSVVSWHAFARPHLTPHQFEPFHAPSQVPVDITCMGLDGLCMGM